MFESISFKGVDLLFSKFLVISLINTLNNVGFHESPCLTPLEMFENNKSTPLKLIDSNIGCLLFADDLLILSETKEGLQHSLNNLSNYSDNWQLAINVNKTKSMIFKQNYTKTEPSFVYYRNNQIQNVSEYPFLDITLKSNGNLSHSITDLVKKAKKALFCIKSYTTSLNNLPVKPYIKI
jgi:hypothetical protein